MLEGALKMVVGEYWRACGKFTAWPTDPVHAAAVVQEEAGELVRACLQMTYEPHKVSREAVLLEAIQTAAMAVRFIVCFCNAEVRPSPQTPDPTDCSKGEDRG